MTNTLEPEAIARHVYFHDPHAPTATSVVPTAFVAARGPAGEILLVRRRDTGVWELPGGRVDVGESVTDTACRETLEEAGVSVRITGLLGLYTDPGEVIRGLDGAVRQQFAAVFGAEVVDGTPRPDGSETDAVAWIAPDDVSELPVEPATRIRINHSVSATHPPHAHTAPGAALVPDEKAPGTEGWSNRLGQLLRSELHETARRGEITPAEADRVLVRLLLVLDRALWPG